MKKKLSILFYLVLVASLLFINGCGRDNLNPAFTDENRSSYADFIETINDYRGILDDFFDSIFNLTPPHDNASYVDVELKNSYNHYEAINYHLVDDRDFYTHIHSTRHYDGRTIYMYENLREFDIYPFTKGLNENCRYIAFNATFKEGQLTTFNTDLIDLYQAYYELDGDKLFLMFDIPYYSDSPYTHSYKLYFSKNANGKLVVNGYYMDTIFDSEEVKTNTPLSYFEFVQDSYALVHSLYPLGKLETNYYNIRTNDYIHLYQQHYPSNYHSNTYILMEYYSGENDETYDIFVNNRGLETESYDSLGYTKYINHALLVSLRSDGSRFKVDLHNIPGWDEIRKNSDNDTWNLYRDDQLISPNLNVYYNIETGEAKFSVYEDIDPWTPSAENIYTLHEFNLESGYTGAMFQAKYQYIEENYLNILADHNLEEPINITADNILNGLKSWKGSDSHYYAYFSYYWINNE